jgi:hypothetical protein
VKHRVNASLQIVALLALTLGIGQEALAHHSFAMFDKKKYLTLKGLVRKLEWANPHTYLYLQVPQKNGVSLLYTVECSSPNELSRWGWKYNMVKAGDTVTIGMFPLRDGERGGLLYSVTLANGTVLKAN